MCSRNLFVLDFTRRFFVRCVQIFEAYAVRTLIKFERGWRKIGRKSKCGKNSESTSYIKSAQTPPDWNFGPEVFVYSAFSSLRFENHNPLSAVFSWEQIPAVNFVFKFQKILRHQVCQIRT